MFKGFEGEQDVFDRFGVAGDDETYGVVEFRGCKKAALREPPEFVHYVEQRANRVAPVGRDGKRDDIAPPRVQVKQEPDLYLL